MAAFMTEFAELSGHYLAKREHAGRPAGTDKRQGSFSGDASASGNIKNTEAWPKPSRAQKEWQEVRRNMREGTVGSVLVAARLDRITRRAHTLSQLLEDGFSIRATDMPGADDLMMRIYAAMAQKERELISERTGRVGRPLVGIAPTAPRGRNDTDWAVRSPMLWLLFSRLWPEIGRPRRA